MKCSSRMKSVKSLKTMNLTANLGETDHVFYYSTGYTVHHTHCHRVATPRVVWSTSGRDHCGPVPLRVLAAKLVIILKKLKKS